MNGENGRLPVGIHTFHEIRESGCYYVDKTGFAGRLIAEGKCFFLSRPQRFGKSVFIDTLKELLEGNEKLFEGLAVHSGWDWSTRYPVVRLDFSGGCFNDREDLRADLLAQMEALETEAGVHEEGARSEAVYLSIRFNRLITELHRRTGRRVAVLVDAYDKPVLDTLRTPEVAKANRDLLIGVYTTVKSADAHIKFAFFTGMSKFYTGNMFSGLNNLLDITRNPDYSAVCGFTEKELDAVFATELEGLDRQMVREWYNGYGWLGDEKVYNPYDVLQLLRHREFDNYWFKTGSPESLADILIDRTIPTPTLSGAVTSGRILSDFDVDYIATEALLFQSGYLTVVGEETYDWSPPRYTLDYPNLEVRQGFNRVLLERLTGMERLTGNTTADRVFDNARLRSLLADGDTQGTRELFEAVYASIPDECYTRSETARFKGYYASVFYSCFAAAGLDVIVEDSSSLGCADMAVRTPRRVWLFEFKIVEASRAEASQPSEGLQQMRERGYADKYRAEGVEVVLAAIEFSPEKRNIISFQTATA